MIIIFEKHDLKRSLTIDEGARVQPSNNQPRTNDHIVVPRPVEINDFICPVEFIYRASFIGYLHKICNIYSPSNERIITLKDCNIVENPDLQSGYRLNETDALLNRLDEEEDELMTSFEDAETEARETIEAILNSTLDDDSDIVL